MLLWLYRWLGKIQWNVITSKRNFYSNTNIDIIDGDYAHSKRVCKDFEIKNLGECHDLHIRSDKILLADISESFRNMYLNIYELDPGKFLSAPGLAWQAALKKTKAKLDLLT